MFTGKKMITCSSLQYNPKPFLFLFPITVCSRKRIIEKIRRSSSIKQPPAFWYGLAMKRGRIR